MPKQSVQKRRQVSILMIVRLRRMTARLVIVSDTAGTTTRVSGDNEGDVTALEAGIMHNESATELSQPPLWDPKRVGASTSDKCLLGDHRVSIPNNALIMKPIY